MTRFKKDISMPEESVETWPLYRKRSLTRAKRITGPFEVVTSEGTLTCQDGYLCIDSRGYPYPVAVDEFTAIYDLVD